MAIDPLQGQHQVIVELLSTLLSIKGALPFGIYNGQLVGNQANLTGVFKVHNVNGAASQAGAVFTVNGQTVSLQMWIQRGLFGVLPGGKSSDWNCFGNHL